MSNTPAAAHEPMTSAPSRRGFLRGVGVLAAGTAVPSAVRASVPLDWPATSPRPRLAVSDAGLNLRGQASAAAVARAAGLDGIELDMGRLGRGERLSGRLTDAAGRQVALDTARAHDIAIAAVALTAFRHVPFAQDPRLDEAARDWFATLRQTGVRVGVFELGDATPLNDGDDVRPIADRLRALARIAEHDGLTLSLYLPGRPAAVTDLLDRVGSPALKADVVADAHATTAIARLGADRLGRVRVGPATSAETLAGVAAALHGRTSSGWIVLDRVTLADGRLVEACETAAAPVQAAFA